MGVRKILFREILSFEIAIFIVYNVINYELTLTFYRMISFLYLNSEICLTLTYSNLYMIIRIAWLPTATITAQIFSSLSTRKAITRSALGTITSYYCTIIYYPIVNGCKLAMTFSRNASQEFSCAVVRNSIDY